MEGKMTGRFVSVTRGARIALTTQAKLAVMMADGRVKWKVVDGVVKVLSTDCFAAAVTTARGSRGDRWMPSNN